MLRSLVNNTLYPTASNLITHILSAIIILDPVVPNLLIWKYIKQTFAFARSNYYYMLCVQ